MIGHEMSKEEVVARGKQIYNEKLRAQLERDHGEVCRGGRVVGRL